MGNIQTFSKIAVYGVSLLMIVEGIVCFFGTINPITIFQGIYFMYNSRSCDRVFGLLLASAQCGFKWYKTYFAFLESYYGRAAFCSLYSSTFS